MVVLIVPSASPVATESCCSSLTHMPSNVIRPSPTATPLAGVPAPNISLALRKRMGESGYLLGRIRFDNCY